MNEILEAINGLSAGQVLGRSALALAIVGSLVEITPIKFNPISAILRWLGKRLNSAISEQVEALSEKQDILRDTVDDNEIDRIRWEILDFANSCRNGRKHTMEEFDHVIELNTKYHAILKRRNLTNGKIDLEYAYIESLYKRCQQENSFL